MDPLPIGRGLCLSVSDFKGNRYFHIRKYFEGKPTRFGVALSSNETIFLNSRMPDVRLALNNGYDRVYFGDKAWLTIGPNEITFEKNGKSVRVEREHIHKIGRNLTHVLKEMVGVDSIDEEILTAKVQATECSVCGNHVTPDIYGMYKCTSCIPRGF